MKTAQVDSEVQPKSFSEITSPEVTLRAGVGQSPNVRINGLDTLVSKEPVQPIIPLGRLTKMLKCKVKWSSLGCEIVHPVLGRQSSLRLSIPRTRVTMIRKQSQVPLRVCGLCQRSSGLLRSSS